MLERSARELPEMADLLNAGIRAPVLAALTEYLAARAEAGLRMSFGATEVLHGIDFDVRYGEVFCLLGPNGAGKTTTLEILEGFTAQTDGHVSVLGMNPAAQPARLRERAGMVLQECGFPRRPG